MIYKLVSKVLVSMRNVFMFSARQRKHKRMENAVQMIDYLSELVANSAPHQSNAITCPDRWEIVVKRGVHQPSMRVFKYQPSMRVFKSGYTILAYQEQVYEQVTHLEWQINVPRDFYKS